MMVRYVFGSRLLPLTPLLKMIAEAKDESDYDSDDSDSGYGMNECGHYYVKPNIDIKVLQCMIYYLLHEFLNNIMGILQGMKRNLKKMPFMLEVEFIFNGEEDLWGDDIYKLVQDNMHKYLSKTKTKTPSPSPSPDPSPVPDMKQEEETAELVFGIKALLNLNKKKLQEALKRYGYIEIEDVF